MLRTGLKLEESRDEWRGKIVWNVQSPKPGSEMSFQVVQLLCYFYKKK